jgi:transposase-like protein
MDKQQSRRKFSPEVRARAVRMAIKHRGDHRNRLCEMTGGSASAAALFA